MFLYQSPYRSSVGTVDASVGEFCSNYAGSRLGGPEEPLYVLTGPYCLAIFAAACSANCGESGIGGPEEPELPVSAI